MAVAPSASLAIDIATEAVERRPRDLLARKIMAVVLAKHLKFGNGQPGAACGVEHASHAQTSPSALPEGGSDEDRLYQELAMMDWDEADLSAFIAAADIDEDEDEGEGEDEDAATAV